MSDGQEAASKVKGFVEEPAVKAKRRVSDGEGEPEILQTDTYNRPVFPHPECWDYSCVLLGPIWWAPS